MPSAQHASASAARPEAAAAAREAGALAELFLTLAAAFVPPPAEMPAREWCSALAADLEELGEAAAIDTAEAVARLHESAAAAPDAPWLVEYSGLFLVPPVRVTLNTGVYLEGGLAGVSAQMLARCYAAAGLERSERFRDLPDHVAIQLEFLGALLERASRGDAEAAAMAAEFVASFVDHWAEPLRDACLRAAAVAPAGHAFAALADLARAGAERVAR